MDLTINVKDITIRQLLDSRILPPNHGKLISLGMNWFRDRYTGICYHIGHSAGLFAVLETRQSIVEKKHKKWKPRPPKPKFTEITCMVCGVTRTVTVQDVHQVKKCRACQIKHRLERRLKQYYEAKEERDRINQ